MNKILFLHGAIGAQDHLQPLAESLRDAYEVVPFNFSGHGGKPFSSHPFSIKNFAQEVYHFLKENNFGSIPVFGYSMGGYVAFYLAKHYPDCISKIITLATKFHWDEAIAEREIKMLDAEKIEQKLPAFAQALKNRHAPNDWKIVLNKTKTLLCEMGKDIPLKLEDYAALKIPCLLTIGDKDKMVSFEETTDVYKVLPNAQMAMLPDTQHPIEQTNIFILSTIIKQFLNR